MALCRPAMRILSGMTASRLPVITSACRSSRLPIVSTYCCNFHTSQPQQSFLPAIDATGFAKKMFRKIGFLDVNKSRLGLSGYYLLEDVVDKLDYAQFFKELELTDSFFSWFLVTEVHIWMIMVRLSQEGEEGKVVKKNLINAMWNDVEKRCTEVTQLSSSYKIESIDVMSKQFNAALFNYDEGLLSNDMVLSGALWRRFFEMKDIHPQHLEKMVQYVRKQVQHLDSLDGRKFILGHHIKWLPLTK